MRTTIRFFGLNLIVAVLALFGADVNATETNSLRLAVVPFFAPSESMPLQQAAKLLPDLLSVRLSGEPQFQLVEREKINVVWAELNLAEAGFISADTVEKFGRILSCDWLVSGTMIQAGTNTQVWVKVIDIRSSIVLDLQAFPFDPHHPSAAIPAIADFLKQVNPRSQPRQFIALGQFADLSLSSTRADWSQRLPAMIEKHFLAEGYGVVEREAIAPIFSEFQLETAGMTEETTNRVNLKPAFWIVDGGCQWVYDTQDELSVALRIRKVGSSAQVFRFTRPPGDTLEEAVITTIESALTNAGPMSQEQAQAAEASLRATNAMQLATGHDEFYAPARYATNPPTAYITITDAFGQTRQLTVDPDWLARREKLKSDTIATLQQAVLLNPNDLHSKFLLGMAMFLDADPAQSQQGRELLHQVAASSDTASATRAKNWLEGFDSGRLSIKRLDFGGVQIISHDLSHPVQAQTNLTFQQKMAILQAIAAKQNEITNIATRSESFVQIPAPLSTGFFDGITAVKFWQGKVLIASGTTLQSYDPLTESTIEIRLPLKLESQISCIEADENDLWLGTTGSGLIQISKSGGTARVFDEKNGFPMPVITALRMMQNRLLIGFGFHGSGAIGYLDTKTEKFTGLMGETRIFRMWPEAATNPPEYEIRMIVLMDKTNILVESSRNAFDTARCLQFFNFQSQKWSIAYPEMPDGLLDISISPDLLAALVPMRCVAISPKRENRWTCLNLSTDFDLNSSCSMAMDQSNPKLLWVGLFHGKVALLDTTALKVIGECKLDTPSEVKWIFDDVDRMVFIAMGKYAETYDIYCLKKSTLTASSQPVESSAESDDKFAFMAPSLPTNSVAGPDDQNWRDEFLQKNFDKFVPVRFQKDADGNAMIQRLRIKGNVFAYQGNYFCGLKFTVPEWLDGNFEWMYLFAKTEANKNFHTSTMSWYIIPESGQSQGFDDYYSEGFSGYTRLKAQFPYTGILTTQSLDKDRLKAGKTYGIWFRFREQDMPDIAFAMTIDSQRGTNEFGSLPIH